jgi:hypothetical protein
VATLNARIRHFPTEQLTLEWVLLAESRQVFLAVAGTFLLGVMVTSWIELENLPRIFSLIAGYVSEFLLAGWFYAVGRNLYRIRPDGARLRFGWFVFHLVYFLIYSIVLLFLSLSLLDAKNVTAVIDEAWALLPFHILAVVSACSIVAFVSRALVSVELRQHVPFGIYSGTFLLLFFFPFGIWIVQPRVQAIFRDQISLEDDLAGDLLDL